MTQNKRIAIFISFSGQGGVERMINNLAGGFLGSGYGVDMIIARADGDHLAAIPAGVNQIRLGTKHTLTALPGLIRYLKREKPHVLLAVKDRAIRTAVVARWLSGVAVLLVGRIGTTVSAALVDRGPLRRWSWFKGMKLFYGRVDRIIAVSRGVAEDIIAITGMPSNRVVIVSNPVVTPRLNVLASEPVPHPWLEDPDMPVIMGAGRLTSQKDFGTLLRAFALVQESRACRLVILGEGKLRAELLSLADALGVGDLFLMPGFAANPYKWIARCSVFVLSSRWEGSPNTLTEALALGVPVVSTNCRSGPKETPEDGKYGSLVPVGNVGELARAIQDTLVNPLPQATLQNAVRRFTVEESVKGYLLALGMTEDL